MSAVLFEERSPALADQIAAVRKPEDLAKLPFVANMDLKEPLLWQFSPGELSRRFRPARSPFLAMLTQAEKRTSAA